MVGIYVDEEDLAMYVHHQNYRRPTSSQQTVYLRPPKNILSQSEVEIWEKLIGKELKKSSISREEFLASLKGKINSGLISKTSVARNVPLGP